MKRTLRSIALPAALAAAGLFAAASPSPAGVFVTGFHGPRVSVSVGVGPFVPGYVVTAPRVVFYRPSFGYGFWAPAGFGYRSPYWVPVHRFRTHWVVSPYGRHFRGYGRHFRHGHPIRHGRVHGRVHRRHR
jgi:hypothetical protein